VQADVLGLDLDGLSGHQDFSSTDTR
jgi:hypothetical protein